MLRCQCPSACLSVRVSVTEVHWRIIANLGQIPIQIYRPLCSQPTMRPHALQVAVHAGALWSRCMPGRGEGSSRTMLATTRPSYCIISIYIQISCG